MPASRPLNPTVLVVLVGVVWVVIQVAFSAPWFVTLLAAAIAVNALLWLHAHWDRRRKAHALDHTRPHSREDDPA